MHAFGSFSIVVDVAVDNGEVLVKRVVCAVDCGMVVNPNTIEAQVQGGIIFGITGALYGEITIEEGRVVQSNFTDYRMLRINETPPIEVHLVKAARRRAGSASRVRPRPPRRWRTRSSRQPASGCASCRSATS